MPLTDLNAAPSTSERQRDLEIRLRFGAGRNTSSSPLDVALTECTSGENFVLGLDSQSFRPRSAINKVATAPNAAAINGFVELIKTDGSVTLLVQAGGNVYSWDGASSFTLQGTVPASSRLRGGRHSTSLLDDKVIITDLKKLVVVKSWDGTTFEDHAHDLGGELFAKYAIVSFDRLLLANVKTSVDTPHLLAASAGPGNTPATSGIGEFSISAIPAGNNDAWFLTTPDLRPVNGMLDAFGETILSTGGSGKGLLWKLAGDGFSGTTNPYNFQKLFANSGVAGEEAIVEIGNDVIWGRHGKIESLVGTEAFGDVEADDVSRWIAPDVEEVREWACVLYNQRFNRAYFWPKDGNEIHVLHKSLVDPFRKIFQSRVANPRAPNISPWSKWTTTFGAGDFRPSAAAVLRRPGDKLDFTYLGNEIGEIFELEGNDLLDGGTDSITTTRTSPVIRGLAGDAYDVKAEVWYRKSSATTLTITLEWQGKSLFDSSLVFTLPTLEGGDYFGGDVWFGGDFFFGTKFEGRLQRQENSITGRGGAFQVKTTATGTEFDIHEIRLTFSPAIA